MRGNNYNIRERISKPKAQKSQNTNANHGRESNLVLSEFGKDILLVRNYDDVKIQTLVAYDVILLDYFKPTRADQMLNKIRSSVYDELYLKPVFLSIHGKDPDPVAVEMADGIVTGSSIETVLDIIEDIDERSDEILKVSTDFKGRKVLLKLIRFLYSRDKALKPIPTSNSHMGFSFPFLDANIEVNEYQELLDLLKAGEERGLIQSDFEENVHLCNNCYSGFIHYKETCPKCGTNKLKSQHTIHHFVCGYVGPESDFVNGDKLECPKCSRQLRHIGVDYDKPSVIMECENGHVFQETEMKTFCFNCHTEARPSDLITYSINSYELTASGGETAISGKSKGSELSNELDGFVSINVFKTFLKMEVARQQATGKSSVISYLNLMLCPSTIKKHQHHFSEFINEIARVIKAQLKPTEVVTFLNDESFLIMSPEAEMEETENRLSAISKKAKSMIVSACEGNKNDEIVFNSLEVSGERETDAILEQINNQIHIF